MGKIYLMNGDESLSELTETPYSSEKLLQQLLEKYPDLLAGDQINSESPRKWLFITSEFSIPGEERENQSGYLDHLFLDQDGIPTLIEVKRSSDSRIRREVVGQMLDYAANAVVYWSIEKIQYSFDSTCNYLNLDPVKEIANLLEVDEKDQKVDDFWNQVKSNLGSGHIRMIFVADVIPNSLRRIVEFLNSQMDPAEVYAIEVKQYIGDGLKTLVPRVLGLTSEADRKSSNYRSETKKWSEESFYPELINNHGDLKAKVAKKIQSWAQKNKLEVWWGRGKVSGSFVPNFYHNEIQHQIFAVWTNGTVEIYFQWYQSKAYFDEEKNRLELLNRLNSIDGVNISREAISRRPSISLSILSDQNKLSRFLQTFDWYIEMIKAT